MLSPKQQELYDLLYSLDYEENPAAPPNQQELGIDGMVSIAEEEDCIDEVKKIVLENKDKDVLEVLLIIWKSGLLPTVEIVEDDEYDEGEED